MATLIVRNLDADLVRRLEERAAANGRSVEAEHRLILAQTLRPLRTGRDLWESLARGERVEIDLDRSSVDQEPKPAFRDLLSPGEELTPVRASGLSESE